MFRARIVSGIGFSRRVIARFIDDRCLTGASALSYATIVSLVPLIAIAFGIFSAFPIFGPLRARLMGLALDNFAPEIGAESATMLTGFADHAASATMVGVIGLVVTAILLLATIEEHLHNIFRIATPRSWGQRIVAYWTVLTLGPVVLGAMLTVSGDIDALLRRIGVDGSTVEQAARAWSDRLQIVVSFGVAVAAFALLYRLIPNRAVPWRAAGLGGLLTAGLLEVLKFAFAIYIGQVATYNSVYGALAGVPIALLWMYIFWGSVLLGAEFAACLADGETSP